jgi:hypothetical protein
MSIKELQSTRVGSLSVRLLFSVTFEKIVVFIVSAHDASNKKKERISGKRKKRMKVVP